jgi:hypothetical protein
MLIHYRDGSAFGACSLHCAALELAYRPGKIPVKIQVADYHTKSWTSSPIIESNGAAKRRKEEERH